MIDRKLTWENLIQHVVKKLCIAEGLLSKLWYHAPLTVLRSVYYSIVHSHLQYGVTSWGNAVAKYLKKIEVQQNYIIKIIIKAPFFKLKLLQFTNN